MSDPETEPVTKVAKPQPPAATTETEDTSTSVKPKNPRRAMGYDVKRGNYYRRRDAGRVNTANVKNNGGNTGGAQNTQGNNTSTTDPKTGAGEEQSAVTGPEDSAVSDKNGGGASVSETGPSKDTDTGTGTDTSTSTSTGTEEKEKEKEKEKGKRRTAKPKSEPSLTDPDEELDTGDTDDIHPEVTKPAPPNTAMDVGRDENRSEKDKEREARYQRDVQEAQRGFQELGIDQNPADVLRDWYAKEGQPNYEKLVGADRMKAYAKAFAGIVGAGARSGKNIIDTGSKLLGSLRRLSAAFLSPNMMSLPSALAGEMATSLGAVYDMLDREGMRWGLMPDANGKIAAETPRGAQYYMDRQRAENVSRYMAAEMNKAIEQAVGPGGDPAQMNYAQYKAVYDHMNGLLGKEVERIMRKGRADTLEDKAVIEAYKDINKRMGKRGKELIRQVERLGKQVDKLDEPKMTAENREKYLLDKDKYQDQLIVMELLGDSASLNFVNDVPIPYQVQETSRRLRAKRSLLDKEVQDAKNSGDTKTYFEKVKEREKCDRYLARMDALHDSMKTPPAKAAEIEAMKKQVFGTGGAYGLQRVIFNIYGKDEAYNLFEHDGSLKPKTGTVGKALRRVRRDLKADKAYLYNNGDTLPDAEVKRLRERIAKWERYEKYLEAQMKYESSGSGSGSSARSATRNNNGGGAEAPAALPAATIKVSPGVTAAGAANAMVEAKKEQDEANSDASQMNTDDNKKQGEETNGPGKEDAGKIVDPKKVEEAEDAEKVEENGGEVYEEDTDSEDYNTDTEEGYKKYVMNGMIDGSVDTYDSFSRAHSLFEGERLNAFRDKIFPILTYYMEHPELLKDEATKQNFETVKAEAIRQYEGKVFDELFDTSRGRDGILRFLEPETTYNVFKSEYRRLKNLGLVSDAFWRKGLERFIAPGSFGTMSPEMKEEILGELNKIYDTKTFDGANSMLRRYKNLWRFYKDSLNDEVYGYEDRKLYSIKDMVDVKKAISEYYKNMENSFETLSETDKKMKRGELEAAKALFDEVYSEESEAFFKKKMEEDDEKNRKIQEREEKRLKDNIDGVMDVLFSGKYDTKDIKDIYGSGIGIKDYRYANDLMTVLEHLLEHPELVPDTPEAKKNFEIFKNNVIGAYGSYASGEYTNNTPTSYFGYPQKKHPGTILKNARDAIERLRKAGDPRLKTHSYEILSGMIETGIGNLLDPEVRKGIERELENIALSDDGGLLHYLIITYLNEIDHAKDPSSNYTDEDVKELKRKFIRTYEDRRKALERKYAEKFKDDPEMAKTRVESDLKYYTKQYEEYKAELNESDSPVSNEENTADTSANTEGVNNAAGLIPVNSSRDNDPKETSEEEPQNVPTGTEQNKIRPYSKDKLSNATLDDLGRLKDKMEYLKGSASEEDKKIIDDNLKLLDEVIKQKESNDKGFTGFETGEKKDNSVVAPEEEVVAQPRSSRESKSVSDDPSGWFAQKIKALRSSDESAKYGKSKGNAIQTLEAHLNGLDAQGFIDWANKVGDGLIALPNDLYDSILERAGKFGPDAVKAMRDHFVSDTEHRKMMFEEKLQDKVRNQMMKESETPFKSMNEGQLNYIGLTVSDLAREFAEGNAEGESFTDFLCKEFNEAYGIENDQSVEDMQGEIVNSSDNILRAINGMKKEDTNSRLSYDDFLRGLLYGLTGDVSALDRVDEPSEQDLWDKIDRISQIVPEMYDVLALPQDEKNKRPRPQATGAPEKNVDRDVILDAVAERSKPGPRKQIVDRFTPKGIKDLTEADVPKLKERISDPEKVTDRAFLTGWIREAAALDKDSPIKKAIIEELTRRSEARRFMESPYGGYDDIGTYTKSILSGNWGAGYDEFDDETAEKIGWNLARYATYFLMDSDKNHSNRFYDRALAEFYLGTDPGEDAPGFSDFIEGTKNIYYSPTVLALFDGIRKGLADSGFGQEFAYRERTDFPKGDEGEEAYAKMQMEKNNELLDYLHSLKNMPVKEKVKMLRETKDSRKRRTDEPPIEE